MLKTRSALIPSLLIGWAAFAVPDVARAGFRDVTVEAGVRFQHHKNPNVPVSNPSVLMGAGAAWLDFNRDGWPDLYATQGNGCNHLFRNNGDGTFTDLAQDLGVADCADNSNGVVAGDYDNDGYQDIFVTNFGQSRLYRNLAGAGFEDVTAAAGLLNTNGPLASMSASWGDFDNDGYLDLYVGNYVIDRTGGGAVITCQANNLWRNRHDGRFVDLASLFGVHLNGNDARPGCTLAVTWSDYDNDGDPDLFVVNDTGMDARMPANVLFRNDGAVGAEWKFTDVTEPSGANFNIAGIGIGIGDTNNDGNLDYYMTSMGSNIFAHNLGNGRFQNIAAASGTGSADAALFGGMGLISWGNVFADFDNDGRVDLFVVHGGDIPGVSMFSETLANQPNYMYRNLGGDSFAEVHRSEGLLDAQSSRAVAVADYDNDGDVDIYVGNVDGTNILYRTDEESAHNWLKVHAIGTIGNRDAIGARITLSAGSASAVREVDGGSSFLSMHSLDQSFGLSKLTRADRVVVKFRSGLEYELRNVPANGMISVVEPMVALSSSLKKATVRRGDSFVLPLSIKNYSAINKTVQSWWTAITPVGAEGLVKPASGLTLLTPGQQMSASVGHTVPLSAATGLYLYIAKIGTFPDQVMHQYVFELRVTD